MFTSQITEIPGFRVTQTIGAGSAGWVYQARRIEDGLVVALKVLRPEAQADPEQVARFRREQLLLQKLESPYLVRFIQADLESTPVWIATELLEGGSLAVRLRPKTGDRKALKASGVIRLAIDLSSGLALLHENGILHRDLKPSNILFRGDGTAVLSDLGLAKIADQTTLTRPGQILGSVAYMAPELLAGARESPQTDLFGLGVCLYEALTGQHPNDRRPFPRSYSIPDPARSVSGCPESLRKAILVLLQPDPLCRPPSARTLLGYLAPAGELLGGETRVDEAPVTSTPPQDDPDNDTADGPKGYTIQQAIGEGGMATVYRAWHEPARREVALKVCLATGEPDAAVRERTVREVEILSKISHPNIIKVLDAGWWKRRFFLAMPLVHGATLAHVIESTGKMPLVTVREVALKLAKALEYMHERGLLHRDIKPGNVMIEQGGEVYLMDLGLALDPDLARLTRTGEFLGTPLYSAPETLSDMKYTVRTDIYQLGVTLLETMTGVHPYGRSQVEGWFLRGEDPRKATVQGLPTAPPEGEPAGAGLTIREELRLAECFARACAADPDERFESVNQMVGALERILSGQAASAVGLPKRPSGLTPRLSRHQTKKATPVPEESPSPAGPGAEPRPAPRQETEAVAPRKASGTRPVRRLATRHAAVFGLGAAIVVSMGILAVGWVRMQWAAPPPPASPRPTGVVVPTPSPQVDLSYYRGELQKITRLYSELGAVTRLTRSGLLGEILAELREVENVDQVLPRVTEMLTTLQRLVNRAEQDNLVGPVWMEFLVVAEDAVEACRYIVFTRKVSGPRAQLEALCQRARTLSGDPFRQCFGLVLSSHIQVKLSRDPNLPVDRAEKLERAVQILDDSGDPWCATVRGVYEKTRLLWGAVKGREAGLVVPEALRPAPADRRLLDTRIKLVEAGDRFLDIANHDFYLGRVPSILLSELIRSASLLARSSGATREQAIRAVRFSEKAWQRFDRTGVSPVDLRVAGSWADEICLTSKSLGVRSAVLCDRGAGPRPSPSR